MPLQTMVARQPSFVSPFSLTASKRTTVHGFLSWFDTWFMPSKEPVPTNGRPELKGGERLEGLPPVTVIPPVDADVPALALKRDQVVEEQDVPESQRGEVVSFTTGPEGLETHWKQTVFLLKEPLEVEQGRPPRVLGPPCLSVMSDFINSLRFRFDYAAGTLITGEIHVTASDTNSRELDVEVHYSVRAPGSGADRQKGDKVEARIVQLYHVR